MTELRRHNVRLETIFKGGLEYENQILQLNFGNPLMLEYLFSRMLIQHFMYFKCYQNKAAL